MNKNKLTIWINKPIDEVFEYTITPENTSKWIDFIQVEKTNEWPIKIGTIYKNQNKTTKKWNEYTVSKLKQNKVFELTSKDENLYVRYTYREIGDQTTELEYSEWVDKGELDEPFTMDILEKLKEMMEES